MTEPGGSVRGRRCWVYDNEDWVLEYTQTLDVAAGNYKNDIAKIATHGPGIDEPLMISIRNDLVPTLMAGPGGTLSCSTCMQDTYPLTDALGSVLCLVDDTGALVQSYAYDSFGRVLAESGGIPNEYGFTGREVDRNSGMMQYRNRWYDPGTGRFVSEDPDGVLKSRALHLPSSFKEPKSNGSTRPGSWYSYTEGNPIRRTDPDGKFLTEVFLVINATCAAVVGWQAANETLADDPNFRHCYASCRIASTCGQFTANAAAIGKEISDMIIPNRDPSWEDIEADLEGVRCNEENKCKGGGSRTGCVACCSKKFSR